MTRLFIRFYLGVIAILIGAWLIQSYVFRQRSETQNIRVVEQALSGGARLARDELAKATADEAGQAFRQIEERFDYPLQVFDLGVDWLDPQSRKRLQRGDVVFLGNHVAIAATAAQSTAAQSTAAQSTAAQSTAAQSTAAQSTSAQSTSAEATGAKSAGGDTPAIDASGRGRGPHWGILFGPLPQFVGPSQAEISFGYGTVFLIAAIAIAILLRPVAFQLRAVERTAAAIAHGDLSARIDSSQAQRTSRWFVPSTRWPTAPSDP